VEFAACDTSDEAIAAIADPVQRACALRAIAKTNGTLTPTQSRIYRAAVAELRGDGERKQSWIARRLQISRGRVAHLLKQTRSEAAA
jgi:hypothetical protein